MSSLSKEQQQIVRQRIRSLDYDLPLLVDELTDHVASAVEEEMDGGRHFEEAMETAMAELTAENSHRLQSKVIDSLLRDRTIRDGTWRLSSVAAGGLSLWVFAEYLAYRLFGIAEAGAAYGLLSQVILAAVLWLNLRQVRAVAGRGLRPWTAFKQGARLSYHAATLFLVFLTFFWTAADPEFYRGMQLPADLNLSATRLLFATAAGMFAGTLASGLLVSGVLAVMTGRRMPGNQAAGPKPQGPAAVPSRFARSRGS